MLTGSISFANQQISSYNWQVAAQPGTTNWSNPVHIRVVNADGANEDQLHGGIWSSGFLIEGPTTSSFTSSSSSSASATSTSSVLSFVASATETESLQSHSPTSASSASASQSSFSALSIADKVGVGVGIGLGVPILIALLAGIFLLLKFRGRRDEPEAASEEYQIRPQYDPPDKVDAKYQDLPSLQPIEADSHESRRAELSSQRL